MLGTAGGPADTPKIRRHSLTTGHHVRGTLWPDERNCLMRTTSSIRLGAVGLAASLLALSPAGLAWAHVSSTASPAAGPDLAVTISGQDTAAPGDPLSWTITVRNDGTASAPHVRVTDALPDGVTLEGAAGPGWQCDTTGPVVCTLTAGLAAGASSVLTVDGRLAADYAAGPVVNTVTLDPVGDTPGDDRATATTSVVVPINDNGLLPQNGGFTGGSGVLTDPQPVTSRPAAGAHLLPRTGRDTGLLALVGGGLLVLGCGALLAGRRRQLG